MHVSKENLTTLLKAGPAKVQAEDWEDMRISIVSHAGRQVFRMLRACFENAPFFGK